MVQTNVQVERSNDLLLEKCLHPVIGYGNYSEHGSLYRWLFALNIKNPMSTLDKRKLLHLRDNVVNVSLF